MKPSTSDTLLVHQMRADNCFAYLIADLDTRSAALVDPRADRVSDYLKALQKLDLHLSLVIDTHTHADHLSGAAELRVRTGAEVLMSVAARSDVATRRLRDHDHIPLGAQTIEVLATPGHTDDSLSLRVGQALLSGDALLIGGAGRTDFQNGNPEALYESLHVHLRDLPGELTVYPAHDYAGHTRSTLTLERQTNPLLQLTERGAFVAALRSGQQAKPANMDAIVAANIRGVMPPPQITVEDLALRLAGPDAPLVVDVRMPAEYRAVHLEHSRSIPLDELRERRDELPHERDIVLVCRSGARARLAAAELPALRRQVLEGGLVAWQAAGHPVVEGKPHLSLERQVRVAAGALACIGGALAVTVSPWFGVLPAVVGAGLVYAGITDHCGMAMVLAKLPYNRRDAAGADGGSCQALTASAACATPASGDTGTWAAPIAPQKRV
jgi:glyoxylase-like metal-dependent hydrolase (beta-lactamase superfamily II)